MRTVNQQGGSESWPPFIFIRARKNENNCRMKEKVLVLMQIKRFVCVNRISNDNVNLNDNVLGQNGYNHVFDSL